MFHVLLDTEPFLRENLHFSSKRFRRLGELVRDGHLTVYVSRITVGELNRAIDRRARQAVALLSSKETRRTLGVVAQLSSANLRGLVQRLDADQFVRDLQQELEVLFRSLNIIVLEVEDVSVRELCERYFNARPPFDVVEPKKHEFPDAISVLVAEGCARSLGTTLHVVSGDKGIGAACREEDGLRPIESIAAMNSLVMETLDVTAAPSRIAEEFLEIQREEIGRRVSEAFENSGFLVEEEWEGEVEDVAVQQVELGEFLIAAVAGDRATVEFGASVVFTAHVTASDPEMRAYDSETRSTYSFGWLTKQVEEREEVEGTIELAVDPTAPERTQIVGISFYPDTFTVRFPWEDV